MDALSIRREARVYLLHGGAVAAIVGLSPGGPTRDNLRLTEAASYRPRLTTEGDAIVELEKRCLWTGEEFDEIVRVTVGGKSHDRPR